jgi:phosphoribosyl-AMP cyclohydrolase
MLKTTGGEEIDIKFGKDGLIPVVAQEASTGEVVMLAFMNKEAFALTMQTGKAHFWSRSRQELWLKGATSGQYLLVKEIQLNCEENSLLLKVELAGGVACHTGNKSCFYRQIAWNK